MKRTILYAAAALLLGGCFKSVGYDTDVILKSWVQTESAAELKPAQGVVAYAFEADTVTWTVASYEDALNGVLTRKGTDEAGVSPRARYGLPRRLGRHGSATDAGGQ